MELRTYHTEWKCGLADKHAVYASYFPDNYDGTAVQASRSFPLQTAIMYVRIECIAVDTFGGRSHQSCGFSYFLLIRKIVMHLSSTPIPAGDASP